MSLTLALLLSGVLSAAPSPLANLDFAVGNFTGWKHDGGFRITTATGHGPSLTLAVISCDGATPGRTGLLQRTVVVPPGAGVLRFRAAAVRRKGCATDANLDVLLFDPNGRPLTKQVQSDRGWQPVSSLLASDHGRPRDYLWCVDAYAGQELRLIIMDRDSRPGCYVFCSGFRFVSATEFDSREFGYVMVRLARAHNLGSMARFDSKHFVALSNAEDAFTERRLRDGEWMYQLFHEHFARRGFTLHEPPGKLFMAVFDSQAGFEAYLERKMSPLVTGLFHKKTNRLVIYDFGGSQAFQTQRAKAEQQLRQIPSDLERLHHLEALERRTEGLRADVNTATLMHEVAHQLSFNNGMLNRAGDVPAWLAEGLACYCEASRDGSWQGIGEPNPTRLHTLAELARGQGKLLPLRDLLSDDWLSHEDTVLLGYAQSWALFRLLMEERPRALQTYFELSFPRRSPDHRLADFAEVFGADFAPLERRLAEYVKDLVARNGDSRR